MATEQATTAHPEQTAERLQRLVDGLAARSRFGHAILGVERDDGSFRWVGAAGTANAAGDPMRPETPFFIASVTKLYIATLVLQLHEQGLVDLEAPMAAYLGADRVAGLHRIGDVDHTPEITVLHLLSHTSGLPDYLEGKPRRGRSMYDRLADGEDLSWGLDDALAIVRSDMSPHFPPQDLGADRRKGRYSDTNFQLLIGIVEEVTGRSFSDNLTDRIFRPLGLRSMWQPGHSTPMDPVTVTPDVWSKGRPLDIPAAMASFNDLCGTADDTLRFLGALRAGELFEDPDTFVMMRLRRNRVIWPLIHYGLGMMHFRIGRLNAPGFRPVNLAGHSGATGSWLFHCPELGVTTTGAVDEAKAAALPFRFIPKVLRALTRRR